MTFYNWHKPYDYNAEFHFRPRDHDIMRNRANVAYVGEALLHSQPDWTQGTGCGGMVFLQPWLSAPWISLPCFTRITETSFICEKEVALQTIFSQFKHLNFRISIDRINISDQVVCLPKWFLDESMFILHYIDSTGIRSVTAYRMICMLYCSHVLRVQKHYAALYNTENQCPYDPHLFLCIGTMKGLAC